MDKQILKLLLDYDFYTLNQSRLRAGLFEDEIRDLFEIIEEAHKKYGKTLSTDDLYALWCEANPVATRAEKSEIKDLIEDIENVSSLTSEVAQDIIKGLWKRSKGKDLANLAIAVSEGDDGALLRMEQILAQARDGFLPDDIGEDTTHDIYQLLEANEGKTEFRFNLKTLANVVPGVGRGTFSLIVATPETGKTTFGVSLIAGPGGFCEQGHRVAYVGNEERTTRTMLRAIQATSGMTEQEIIAHPEVAAKRFQKVSELLHMRDAQQWDLGKLGAYVEKVKPAIVVVDQLDKVVFGNGNQPTHERIQQLYTASREFAKKYDVALIAMGQADASAMGQTRIGADQMQNSKIGKQAELDLILTIGKYPDGDGDNVQRFINVPKNKINGVHQLVVCSIDVARGRYCE